MPYALCILLGFILGALAVLAIGAAADQDARRHTTPDEDHP